MKTRQFWYRYSSLDFDAEILVRPIDWVPEDEDRDFSGEYFGPFKTIANARAEVAAKIRSDISEYKKMLATVLSPAYYPFKKK